MGKDGGGMLDVMLHQRSLRRWARAARRADNCDLETLRGQHNRARTLKFHLDRLLHRADERLALPLPGSNSFPRPFNCDWAWRPEFWRGRLPIPGISAVENKTKFGDQVSLFHDCANSELTLRQIRNMREQDLAPYGLALDVFRFDGSYLSIVIDLPDQAIVGLKRSHLVRMDTIVEVEKPLEIFARINIQHGPNLEQIVRELPLDDAEVMVEFDLAYTDLNEKRIEKAWVDLIFEGPAMNQITLRDVTLSRRPRAEL